MSSNKPSFLDRALRVFADVRKGEGATALVMLATIFTLMFSYYVIKVAREGLILSDEGAEVKSYASGAQAAALIILLPAYGWMTSRFDTRKMVFGVIAFFVVCIQGFFLATQAGSRVGIPFYIWVGIFNLSLPALFWGFANETYTKEAGERLFPLIGVGMTGGAAAGSLLAGRLFADRLGAGAVMQVAAGLLIVHALLYAVLFRRPDVGVNADEPDEPQNGLSAAFAGFALVLKKPYLRLIAALLLLLNLVNTTGEYILSTYVVEMANEALAQADVAAAEADAWRGGFIGAFYGDFFFWVNVISVSLQAFVASRLVKVAGLAGVLFALPVIALGAYALAGFGVAFVVFRWAKSAENATDYSIMNLGRAMLWLVTTREEKYKAKQTLDTLVVRLGDVLAAGLVFAGTTWLGLGMQGFAIANVFIALVWLGVAWLLYRSYRALADAQGIDDKDHA